MKTTRKLLLAYALLFAAWMIWSSRAGNPPNGYTNAPFDNFCTSCHTPSSSLDGTVSISGIPPTVEAGQTYPVTLTVTATAGSAVRAGFQLVSAFSDQSNAGDFIPNSSDEGSNSSGGREYIEHRGAKSFSSNAASWSFDWVAPLGPDGASITMYYAGNITNGNSSSSGDRPRSGSMTFSLEATADPLMVSISKSDVSCQGLNDGSAQATASGGTSPYSYAWSNNGTTASINDLPPGSYSVTVTDNIGSDATSSIQITTPPTLTIDALTKEDVLCNEGNSGSASLAISGGTEPYQINWSNGTMGTTITNLTAGDFGVTVSDAHDCQVSNTFSIEEPSAITLAIAAANEGAFMANDGAISVSTSGGAGSYSYLWNTGATTNNLERLAPGTYMLTVTDANGCTAQDMAIIQAFTCSLDANIASVNVDCFGNTTASASVSVSGAAEPVSYSWSTGATTASVDSLMAGMYDVTVQDANQCQAIFAINITQPDSLAIIFNAMDPLCPDDSTGQISANTTGGTAPYSYQWSSGSSQSMVDSLAAGIHVLTVMDATGCTTVDSQVLSFQDSTTAMVNLEPFDTYLDSNGHAIIDMARLEMGITDNCAIDSFWLDSDTLSCSSIDSQMLQISVVDRAGNVVDTILQLVVKDTMAPYFICIEDIQVDSGQIVEYETPIPFDNCQVDTLEMIEGLPSGSLFPVGETKVSYMATDPSGNIGCCSFFVQVGATTNTADQEFSNSITIFPNPSEDRMWIDIRDGNLQNADLTIYDLRGAQMQARTKLDSQNSIDVGHLPSGLYFVMIHLDHTTAVKKVSIH